MAKARPLRVWLIFGEQDAGKSSIIRHLTGVFRDSFVELAQVGSQPPLHIRAIVSSINERVPIVSEADWIADLLATAADVGCPNVLLPMRYDSRTARHPTAGAYFRALAQVARFQFVVAASPAPAYPWLPPITLTVPRTGTTFTNVRARRVAQLFGWR